MVLVLKVCSVVMGFFGNGVGVGNVVGVVFGEILLVGFCVVFLDSLVVCVV